MGCKLPIAGRESNHVDAGLAKSVVHCHTRPFEANAEQRYPSWSVSWKVGGTYPLSGFVKPHDSKSKADGDHWYTWKGTRVTLQSGALA